MITQVENKVKEIKALKRKEYYKQKDTDLQNWGIAKEGKGKKATPIVITDEEYENLIKLSNGVGKTGRNTVAIALRKASSIAMLVCIVAGATALFTSASKGFIWFSLWIMAGFAFFTVFRGLSEAIRLLQQILDGGKGNVPEAEAETPAAPAAPVVAAPNAFYAVQPPVYQAPYPPQAYYAPMPVPPVAPVAPEIVTGPADTAKPTDYSAMPTYDFNPTEDFFAKGYEPKATFGENR